MKLSIKEMVLIRNFLRARKAYANTDVPGGVQIYEPYMETLYRKLEDELEVLS